MRMLNIKEGFTTLVVPIGTVSAGYGSIDSAHKVPHTGIDFVCPTGTPIYAPFDGIVSKVNDNVDTKIGKMIAIKMEEGRQYILGHLSDVSKVHVGDVVHQGDLIALSGNTGTNTTGPHLHFGAMDAQGHFIDPLQLLKLFKETLLLIGDNALEVFAALGNITVDLFGVIQTALLI